MKNKGFLALALAISLLTVTACGQNGGNQEANAQSATPENENTVTVEETDTGSIPLNVRQEVIDVEGINGEHKIFFLADSHISMCDDRDAELMDKATQRAASFAADGIQAQDRFDAIIGKAGETDREMVILGGDIIDSAMYASIEHVKEQLDSLSSPYLLTMGNHDFEYGTEYFSPTAYEQYLPRLNEMRDDTPYQVREYDDIIYFTADDNNSQIDQAILDAYKVEAAKGKPIVLNVHVPIEPVTGDMSLVDECKAVWGPSADDKSRVTMGINGCYPNAVTSEFISLVTAEDSPVVLVLAGHIHFYHKDKLNDKIVQIVTGAAFEGEAVEITLK